MAYLAVARRRTSLTWNLEVHHGDLALFHLLSRRVAHAIRSPFIVSGVEFAVINLSWYRSARVLA